MILSFVFTCVSMCHYARFLIIISSGSHAYDENIGGIRTLENRPLCNCNNNKTLGYNRLLIDESNYSFIF